MLSIGPFAVALYSNRLLVLRIFAGVPSPHKPLGKDL